ncbi:hypothetical protein M0R45_002368 [Rubus argutus]|uniref:Uncharacterized protein n=1 Tax=Rubus argutus TaxID=59490 RepID=A0AAW1VJP1_RUBAR
MVAASRLADGQSEAHGLCVAVGGLGGDDAGSSDEVRPWTGYGGIGLIGLLPWLMEVMRAESCDLVWASSTRDEVHGTGLWKSGSFEAEQIWVGDDLGCSRRGWAEQRARQQWHDERPAFKLNGCLGFVVDLSMVFMVNCFCGDCRPWWRFGDRGMAGDARVHSELMGAWPVLGC